MNNSWKNIPSTTLEKISTQYLCTLICLEIPSNFEIGLDLKSWKIGSLFKGIKLIPPGLRFVHYKQEHKFSLKNGMFIWFNFGDICILRWNKVHEIFENVSSDPQFVELVKAVRNFELDKNLGPYEIDSYEQWTKMTNMITPKMLEMVGIQISQTVEANNEDGSKHNTEALKMTSAKLIPPPSLKKLVTEYRNNELSNNYHEFRNVLFNEDGSRLTPIELTCLMKDPTPIAETSLNVLFKGCMNVFFSQFQLAFLLFLHLADLNAFDFWKDSLELFLACENLKKTRAVEMKFFTELITSHFYLLPNDFFDDNLLESNFLVQCLGTFLKNVDGSYSELNFSLNTLRISIEKLFGKETLTKITQFELNREDDFLTECLSHNYSFHRYNIFSPSLKSDTETSEENMLECTRDSMFPSNKTSEGKTRMKWMLP